jgi:diadenylate cyclase
LIRKGKNGLSMIRALAVGYRARSGDPGIGDGTIIVDSVLTATDGMEKLAREDYQVIISSLDLPDTDGIAFVKLLRSQDIRIPFILVAGCCDPRITAEALDAGADYCLVDAGTEVFHDLLVPVIRNLVHRWQVVQGLYRDNTIMRAIHDASPLAACVVQNHVIIWMNALMPRMLGYEEGDLIGMDPRVLIPDEAEHRRIDQGLFEAPPERGWGFADAELKRKDGSLISVHLLSKPLDPADRTRGSIIIGQDVSDYLRMKDLLRKSEVRYQSLLDSANSIVLRIGTDGIIRFINTFGEEFFGYSSDELVGKTLIGTILPKTSRGGRDLSAMVQDVMRNPEEFEVNVNENMKRNGERVWIAWTNKAIRDEQGRLIEMLSIGNDITDRKLTIQDNQVSTAPWKILLIADTDIDPGVFDTVYSISAELSKEGREGHPIGTIFLIGDAKEVLSKSTQLILNPFEGHPPAARIITNPEIRETVKELSPIDGAFVVNGNGVVEAAGRYITIDTSKATIPRGLGTRHASVAGITRETKAVGIVISQSGGKISIFKDGRIFRVITVHE